MNKQLLSILGLGLVAAVTAFGKNKKPNIIFILTDDQPYELLGCTGNSVVQTPNINKLAEEGVLFTNAHVTSAISCPSRTSILTGRYERSHRINFNSHTSLSDEAWFNTYPMVLSRGGYVTGYIGKNNTPAGKLGYRDKLMESTYDYWYGASGHLGFYPKELWEIYDGAKADTQPEILLEGALDFLSPYNRHLQGAIHFFRKRKTGKPFFLNICFNLPHGASTRTMRQRKTDPEIYRSLYRDQEIPMPKNYVAKADIKTPKLPAAILHTQDRQHNYDYVDTPETLKARRILEMQAVTGIDRLVGAVIKELKRLKIADNTIIVFASDHGIMNGQFGLGGKALCYDKCTRIPFIIYDPRKGHEVDNHCNSELVSSVDIGPTLLEYAGLEAPKDYQGFSLIPMLEGRQDKVRDYLFTENIWSTRCGNPRCESIQNKEWKYIRYYRNDNTSESPEPYELYRYFIEAGLSGEKAVYEELYHIAKDRDEVHNLAGNKKYTDILHAMRIQWRKTLTYARGEEETKVYKCQFTM